MPLDPDLVLTLREKRRDSEWPNDDDLVFTAGKGSPIMPNNLRRRVLKPTAQEAGVPWVGFHTFRHTCASLLFAQGRNAVQVQHWLGHHSAAFTLATYVHLLDGDLGEPLALRTASVAAFVSTDVVGAIRAIGRVRTRRPTRVLSVVGAVVQHLRKQRAQVCVYVSHECYEPPQLRDPQVRPSLDGAAEVSHEFAGIVLGSRHEAELVLRPEARQ